MAIGIDIGATQTRVGTVDRSGQILSFHRCGTLGEETADGVGRSVSSGLQSSGHVGSRDGTVTTGGGQFDTFVTSLARMAADVCGEVCPGLTPSTTVGLAIPGTLDPPRRAVVRSVNLPFLEGRRLGEELGRRISRSVVVLTDAEAGTWGEFHIRERQPDSFVHLRLGSGVACGVVQKGELQRLDAGRSGHLETLVVDDGPEAPQCRCGRRGCLEAIASGAVLIGRASMIGITDGLAGLQAAWERGDEAAQRVVGNAAEALVAAINKVAECYGADEICIGGGVVAHMPGLMQEVADRCPSPSTTAGVQCRWSVVPARLGDDAGVIGAALLAMRHDRLRA